MCTRAINRRSVGLQAAPGTALRAPYNGHEPPDDQLWMRDDVRMFKECFYEEIADSGHCPMLEQPQALVAKILAAR